MKIYKLLRKNRNIILIILALVFIGITYIYMPDRKSVGTDAQHKNVKKIRSLAELERDFSMQKDPVTCLELAVRYSDYGMNDKVSEICRTALNQMSDNHVLLNALAYLLFIQEGNNVDEGYPLIKKALEKNPNEPAYIDTLGWYYYWKGDYKRAEDLLYTATEGSPKEPEIRYHLGMTYLKLNMIDDARIELGKSLILDPHFQDAEKALETVNAK